MSNPIGEIVKDIEHIIDPDTVKVHVANAHDLTTVDRIAEWGSWVSYPVLTTSIGPNVQRVLPQSARRRRAVIAVTDLNLQTILDGAGSVTGPTAGQVIAQITAAHLSQGSWQVEGRAYVDGTVTAAESDNMKVVASGQTVSTILIPNVADSVVSFGPFFVTFPGAPSNISVQAINNGGVAAVYHASLTAVPAGGAAAGAVLVGGREQVMNGQGGILRQGNTIVIESEEEVWISGDGISVGNVTVLDERYSEYAESA